METLKKYSAEFKLDKEEIIRVLDDDDNPPEAEALRGQVKFHQKEAERLMAQIPDSIIVSMFQVNVGQIRDQIVEKHTWIADRQIELIAKMAKRSANATIEAFQKINDKINQQPKDIEELSEIDDFMKAVPQEI